MAAVGGNGWSVLHIACAVKSVPLVGLLLDASPPAAIEALTAHRESPLAVAAGVGCASTCRVLLERGADVNGSGGVSPLVAAAKAGAAGAVSVLIEAGANPAALQGGRSAGAWAKRFGFAEVGNDLLARARARVGGSEADS